MSVLPIIDVSDFAPGAARRPATASAVDEALTRHGFMYVRGHGIDPQLLARAFAASKWLFAQSAELKHRHAYTDVHANFGYQGIESERLDPGNPPDVKESFTMRNALAHADEHDRWPAGDFRDIALSLYIVGLRAAYRILEVMTVSLALPADFFAVRHRGENVTLRFLHYPAGVSPRSAAQLGAGAHTDYGSITVLFQDEVGGLEVLAQDGAWQPAPPVPGAALINTGDLMERWTNSRFRSTVHRVLPVAGAQDRYSIALFVDPDSAVTVDCLASCVSSARPARHPPIAAGEHIREKITATQRGNL